MAERVSNNVSIYNASSNFASYYRIFYSSKFDSRITGIPELPRQLPVSALDRRWVIERKYHYRVDLITYKWYGRDYLDLIWILLLYNQPDLNVELSVREPPATRRKIVLPEDDQINAKPGVDPFKDFPAGREIYIPDRSTIEGRLI